MNYELAKKLKDAGFPQKEHTDAPVFWIMPSNALFLDSKMKPLKTYCYLPTLSELIGACGDSFSALHRRSRRFKETEKLYWTAWTYDSYSSSRNGSTPEEAVANLWISLYAHKK